MAIALVAVKEYDTGRETSPEPLLRALEDIRLTLRTRWLQAHRAVWVVVTRDGQSNITDLEVLSQPPRWDLREGQACYVADVNGGGSARWDG